ncbi:phage holin family protein [Paenibacillus sp. y28]|uniref:phage holin family protein n=1 Tax=Paenibacillus sp. y28 TaxID=3129110 RepID=UPI00301A63D2
MNYQFFFNFMAGAFGAVTSYAFGGWSGTLELLALAMVLDYITGVIAAWKEGNLSSEAGFWGLIKKSLMITAVMLGHRADLAFGVEDVFMTGLVCAFMANELISLAENYGRLGLPLSEHIMPIIAVLKQKGGKDHDNGTKLY